MDKIFENAKFGDKFRTRDGRMALFIQTLKSGEIRNELCVENKDEGRRYYLYKDDGTFYHLHCDKDIVSCWQDTINEEELDKLAKAYVSKNSIPFEPLLTIGEQIEAFKAGYRKAKQKEEIK